MGEGSWPRKARESYHLALEAAPDPLSRATIFEAMGRAYEEARELEAARQAFTAAQEIRETTWGESLALARSLRNLGRCENFGTN